ncbi:MAG: hypothetical protein EON60_14005 [Alphaproteobacteria bacterium]|nr:MAG: hypothetical protein EON60_14005 [Alphaproteobacteria bacterium]
MSVVDSALGMLRAGDGAGAFKAVRAGRSPDKVLALKHEDNLRHMMWRRSGAGYIRLLGRLKHAVENGVTMYRITNPVENIMMPQYDDLLDVGALMLDGKPLLLLLSIDMHMAMEALYKSDLDDEARRERIARVFPHVHLYGQARRITLGRWMLGLVSSRIRAENEAIRKFSAAMEELDQKWAMLEASSLFAYDGWLALLHDIGSGVKFTPEADDGPQTMDMMALLNGSSSTLARMMLSQARMVMNTDEMRYNYPE